MCTGEQVSVSATLKLFFRAIICTGNASPGQRMERVEHAPLSIRGQSVDKYMTAWGLIATQVHIHRNSIMTKLEPI